MKKAVLGSWFMVLGAIAIATAVAYGMTSLPARSSRSTLDAAGPLRVCEDPNNLPFSNAKGEGFENRIATLIGARLNRRVEYTWWAQRRGFVRNTLNADSCDLVPGTASGVEMMATTRPYYRSTYVFLTRRDRKLTIKSFDDPALKHLRIGVQLIGDDGVNTPPVHALTNRGLGHNLVGYTVYGDYAKPNPSSQIVDAVARGDVDVAVVWGPLAGYFAAKSPVEMDVVPVSPKLDLPFLPFTFDIAMGVRRRDTTFRATIDSLLVVERPAIDSILNAYGVPRVR